jgi:hypothetical protein
MVAILALGGVALAATGAGGAAQRPLYSLAATQSCLTRLPDALAGLPPATPPVPRALFVYALARDAESTWGIDDRPPRPHKQLGVWYGDRSYRGIILSFFKSERGARVSLKSLAGRTRIGNVVASWDYPSVPTRSERSAVLGCLRPATAGGHLASPRHPPRASLGTFAGRWGGHGRGLSLTSSGRGREFGNASCCERVYQMTLQILTVSGTLTRAAAVYRVTSFRRYERGVRRLHVGDVGKLLLRNGILTNTLTRDFFCSDPAWGATGACGA